MIKLIHGSKGVGKTKSIIKNANDEITTAKGSHIYITDNFMHTIDIDRRIRFINIADYGIKNEENFLSFIKGLEAANSDITKIYIDGINRFLIKPEDMKEFLLSLEQLSSEYKINFILTISCDALPEFMMRYI